jgi:hypothetical protein
LAWFERECNAVSKFGLSINVINPNVELQLSPSSDVVGPVLIDCSPVKEV